VPTRLLAIGDIHLGRLSGRLPAGLDARALGPAAALRAAVQAAREHAVSAVLLAGDVADGERDLFHALGTLTEVLAPLEQAGIAVLAVAGNHDHEVLPRLAGRLPHLRLLGAGGRWETATVAGPGGPVRVLGWSFPDRVHAASPARGLPRLEPGPPAVGLLHADLDAASSRYAPVTRGELGAAGEVRWLLGHVHAPTLATAGDGPGYLGSLQGLDPTEVGPRGPWLVTVEGDRCALAQLPLAPLRWEVRPLDVEAIADPAAELPEAAHAALLSCAQEVLASAPRTRALGVRLRLTGRAADPAGLAAAAAALTADAHVLAAGELQVFLDAIELAVAPALDLADLAARDDAPGLLARTLLALARGEGQDLVAAAARALGAADRGTNFVPLGMDELPAADVRERLLQTGYQILGELLAGKEAGRGPA